MTRPAAPPPPVRLLPRATATAARAHWSEYGLDVALLPSAPARAQTAMQRLIAGQVGEANAGFLVSLGAVEFGFADPLTLTSVSLYADLASLADTPLPPLPDPAPPAWLTFGDLDGDETSFAFATPWAVALDRAAGRARLAFGDGADAMPPLPAPGAWHSLADGVVAGLDATGRLAVLLLAGLARIGTAPI